MSKIIKRIIYILFLICGCIVCFSAFSYKKTKNQPITLEELQGKKATPINRQTEQHIPNTELEEMNLLYRKLQELKNVTCGRQHISRSTIYCEDGSHYSHAAHHSHLSHYSHYSMAK